MKVEIHKRSRQLLVRKPTFQTHYYFRLIGNNGEPIGQSEQYTQKHNAVEVCEKYFPTFQIVDLTGEKPYRKWPRS